MADDDDFDIDIYGDDKPDFVDEPADHPQLDDRRPTTEVHAAPATEHDEPETEPGINPPESDGELKIKGIASGTGPADHSSQDGVVSAEMQVDGGAPPDPPAEQADFGPDGEDLREVEPGATRALRLSEVQWWVTEDDIRGWLNRARCEGELDSITFNEHKVNGKSKGEVFILLQTEQAATAARRLITSSSTPSATPQQSGKAISAVYAPTEPNPFKTGAGGAAQAARPSNQHNGFRANQGYGGQQQQQSGGYGAKPYQHHNNNGYQQNNFRGRGNFGSGRGGYNRGGMSNGYSNNNNMGMNMGNMGNMGGMGAMGMGMGRGGYNNNMGNMGGNMMMNPMMGAMGMMPGMMNAAAAMGGFGGMMNNMGGFGAAQGGGGQGGNFGGGGGGYGVGGGGGGGGGSIAGGSGGAASPSPAPSNPHGAKRARPD